jgi:exosome complex RNA-binding protein Rrp4
MSATPKNKDFITIALRRWLIENQPKPGHYTPLLSGVPSDTPIAVHVSHGIQAMTPEGHGVFVESRPNFSTILGKNGVVWAWSSKTKKFTMKCPLCDNIRHGRRQDTLRVWLCKKCAKEKDRSRRTEQQREKRLKS